MAGNRTLIIRDPIHGDIRLTPGEVRVLDCPEVQRLRGIRQLGAAYLVYPGCNHTRFDHSLGTLAMAKVILSHLCRAGHDIPAADRELVAIAALVHDVTHIPFGHTFEDERELFPRHDSGHRNGYFFGDDATLGRTLRDLGVREAVLDILAGRGPQPWMGDLVGSTVDADLLDYLRRDAYFASMRHNYDERVFTYFELDGGRLVMNLLKNGDERLDARNEVLHLLRLRHTLTERIYMHHTKLAAGAMISKAVEIAHRTWLREERLYPLSDATFLDLLRHGFPDAAIASLAEGVLSRGLYKRAYVLTGAALGGQQAQLIQRFAGQSRVREQCEAELARRAGVEPHHVILCCPRATLFKEVEVPVRSHRGVVPLSALDSPLSGDVGALARQYADLWRLYVFAPPAVCARVQAAAAAEFGLPSVHQRPA